MLHGLPHAPAVVAPDARTPPGRSQVKEMLLPFGSLKAFNLVMDRNTGNSKVSGASAMCSVCLDRPGRGACPLPRPPHPVSLRREEAAQACACGRLTVSLRRRLRRATPSASS